MTITCGIQPTSAVTMAMKVLHNICNMCIRDLSWTLGRQILRAHVITIRYVLYSKKVFKKRNRDRK